MRKLSTAKVLNPSLIVFPWAASQAKTATKKIQKNNSGLQEDSFDSDGEEANDSPSPDPASATTAPCWFDANVSHNCHNSHDNSCDLCFSHDRKQHVRCCDISFPIFRCP